MKRASAGYSSGVDKSQGIAEKAEPKAERQSSTPVGRAPLIFAIVGVVIALAAGGIYVYKQTVSPPPRTPESTVNEFLAAVFLANDATRVADLVCGSWDPVDALERTTKEVASDTRVSWDEVRVLSATSDRASAGARLGFRFRDDNQPTVYRPWRFSLVKEDGWRVCEARPFVA